MRNSAEPNNQLEMIVSKTRAATLAIVATIKIRIKPTDNVTATPINGSRTNITTAVTSAVIIIAPSINKNRAKGLVTSLPLMIICVFIRLHQDKGTEGLLFNHML
jgi:hypothetical protein